MCSCNKRNSFAQIISDDKSSLPMLKYLYCKYKGQFTYVFGKIGMNVNETNLPALAKLADTGGDKLGMAKGPDGKSVYFSVEDQLRLINANDIENNTCSI